jgi:hypothetical protein
MTNLLQNKLTQRVILLFALMAALAYLRTPGEVRAETCEQICDSNYSNCSGGCTNNQCLRFCAEEFGDCLKSCGLGG